MNTKSMYGKKVHILDGDSIYSLALCGANYDSRLARYYKLLGWQLTDEPATCKRCIKIAKKRRKNEETL